MSQPAELLPITQFPADPEPRVRDLDLAERLGFKRLRAVRQLIRKNRQEIEGYGPLATHHGESRGQKFEEFWLTEPQALAVCALAETPAAALVRRALIETFIAFRRGRASPATAQPSRPARIGAASRQRANQVRHAKLQLAAAAGRLDELGVDVRAIDLAVVLDFSRSFLAARPRLSAAR